MCVDNELCVRNKSILYFVYLPNKLTKSYIVLLFKVKSGPNNLTKLNWVTKTLINPHSE